MLPAQLFPVTRWCSFRRILRLPGGRVITAYRSPSTTMETKQTKRRKVEGCDSNAEQISPRQINARLPGSDWRTERCEKWSRLRELRSKHQHATYPYLRMSWSANSTPSKVTLITPNEHSRRAVGSNAAVVFPLGGRALTGDPADSPRSRCVHSCDTSAERRT